MQSHLGGVTRTHSNLDFDIERVNDSCHEIKATSILKAVGI